VGRLAVRELRLQLVEPLVAEVERDPRGLLPLCIQGEQLAGELAYGLTRARLEVLPRLTAELRKRGRACVGTDVARDLADLLVRHVQAVIAAEGEEQVVARHTGDGLRLEAEQLADAVVLRNDVVARAQVGERLQRAPDARSLGTRRALAEDLRVRKQNELEVAPDEAAASRRD